MASGEFFCKHYRSFDLVHGTPDATMEGALRQVLLTGLMDTTTLIIDSAAACQRVIDQMEPISPVGDGELLILTTL